MKPGSAAFGVGTLLDLLQAWLGSANPFACITELVLIHRDRPRNFFSPCDHRSLELHWFRAFDRELPMVPEARECVKHRVAILPRPIVLPIGNIVQHGCVPILSFERPTHDRPKRAGD